MIQLETTDPAASGPSDDCGASVMTVFVVLGANSSRLAKAPDSSQPKADLFGVHCQATADCTAGRRMVRERVPMVREAKAATMHSEPKMSKVEK